MSAITAKASRKMKKYAVLTREPRCFLGSFDFSWEQRKLEDYLTVSAEKNTGNIYGRSDVLSVSGDYGIVNQIEFQGRSFAGASVSNYGVVQTGDVVYTKSPLNSNPYGIIKTNKGKPGIVSTLYAVYHPKENAFSDFIQVYFEQHARMNNYMHPLVNKGAKNDMKVSAENALKGPVCFPSRIEQESQTKMKEETDMTKQEKDNRVPLWERMNLTLEEAAAYTGIGTDKLRELSNRESCDFVLWVGTKRLLKRKQLEEFLIKSFSI